MNIGPSLNLQKTKAALANYNFLNKNSENDQILCVKQGKNGDHLAILSRSSICWHRFLNWFGHGKQYHLSDIRTHLLEVLKQDELLTTQENLFQLADRWTKKGFNSSYAPDPSIFFAQFSAFFTFNQKAGCIENSFQFDWNKARFVDFKHGEFKGAFLAFQKNLREKTVSLMKGVGLRCNKKGFVTGIEVTDVAQIDNQRKTVQANLKQNEQALTDLFYTLSCAGMAGYADCIRTALAGRVGAKATDVPGSVAFNKYPISYGVGQLEVHEDVWTKAIRDGHSEYLTNTLSEEITPTQEREYLNRRNRILRLHEEGLLHVRVLGNNTKEIDSDTGIYSGKWRMGSGPNLSTTLIPQKGSLIQMKLFDGGSRAVVIDPFTVTPDYFGNGFLQNGVTQQNNFETKLKTRKDGIPLEKVQEALAQENAEVELGLRTKERNHTENAYFRPAARNLVTGLFFKVNDQDFANNLRDLIKLQNTVRIQYGQFLPLFAYNQGRFQEIVVNQQTLEALGLQNEGVVLRKPSKKELERQKERPADYFNFYGDLDTKTVLEAKSALSEFSSNVKEDLVHFENFKNLFELQLMLLHSKGIKDSISFQMRTSFKSKEFIEREFHDYRGDKGLLIGMINSLHSPVQDEDIEHCILFNTNNQYQAKEIEARLKRYKNFINSVHPVDLKMVDQLHLAFPTIFQTKNEAAEAKNLFISHSEVARELRNPASLAFWQQMAVRNMRIFLGIDLKINSTGGIKALSFNENFVPLFKAENDFTGKVAYAKCLSRAIQHLYLLGKDDWVKSIVGKVREKLGKEFGRENNVDFFHLGSKQQSEELKELEQFLESLNEPSFEEDRLNENREGIEIVLAVSRRDTSMIPKSSIQSSKKKDYKTKPIRQLWSQHFGKIDSSDLKQKWQLEVKKSGLIHLSEGKFNFLARDQVSISHFENLEEEGAFDLLAENMESVVVYHTQTIDSGEIPHLLIDTAIKRIGSHLLFQGGYAPSENLLTDDEQRKKRSSIVLGGRITVSAKGGYQSERQKLDKKTSVYFINTLSPQFNNYAEQNEAEVSNFIVKKGYIQGGQLSNIWENTENSIKVAKARGQKPVIEDLRDKAENLLILHEDDPRSLQADVIRLRNGDFYLLKDFKESIHSYLEDLVLPVMEQSAPQGQAIYLKATAFGTGMFSALGIGSHFQTSLQKYVVHSLLESYEQLLQEGKFTKGTVIDFPFYPCEEVPESLRQAAKEAGVHIVWRTDRDFLDFSKVHSLEGKPINPNKYHRVLLNAGDAFSFVGSSSKIEESIGNNSDLRLVFNWYFNIHLLDPSRYQQVLSS